MAEGYKAVLVVDDETDLREMVELVLAEEGYRVLTARDGLEALDTLGRELPGMILLDMKMPGMNGWEFAREFRARYDELVPIVVVTAAQDARQRADEIGARDCLGKPFDLDELIATVERHLGGAA